MSAAPGSPGAGLTPEQIEHAISEAHHMGVEELMSSQYRELLNALRKTKEHYHGSPD